MNFIPTLLTTGADAGVSAGGMWGSMILYIAFFGLLIYFMIYRPQKKQQKKQDELVNSIEIGDSILTTSGFYGVVIDNVDENDVIRAYDYLDGDYKSFYKEYKNDKNVIVQAHPFRKNMELQDLRYLDGIETYNLHPNHNSKVSVAVKLAASHPHMIVTGGTDFHHANHQGMCATCVKKELKNSYELAEILKSRDYLFDISGNKVIPY